MIFGKVLKDKPDFTHFLKGDIVALVPRQNLRIRQYEYGVKHLHELSTDLNFEEGYGLNRYSFEVIELSALEKIIYGVA